ncbi:MAG: coiled-coil domain-containing protein [Flavobacteriia bacterium]
MKNLFLSLLAFVSITVFAQNDVRLSEEIQSFALGSKNSIVVTIPYGNKDIIEKQLKSELKDWNGKFDSKGDEYTMTQGTTKFMGPKPFDAFARIITVSEGNFKVAFAIDLGGAYLSSREHSEQFKAMTERITQFAKETGMKCVETELEKNKDDLSDLEKTQRGLEKDKKNLEEDIEDYKRKIAEAENKIKENVSNQDKQKASIKTQQEKVAETERKMKSLK